jgi:hypothetical protein
MSQKSRRMLHLDQFARSYEPDLRMGVTPSDLMGQIRHVTEGLRQCHSGNVVVQPR